MAEHPIREKVVEHTQKGWYLGRYTIRRRQLISVTILARPDDKSHRTAARVVCSVRRVDDSHGSAQELGSLVKGHNPLRARPRSLSEK